MVRAKNGNRRNESNIKDQEGIKLNIRRKPVVAGNWKMNKNAAEAVALVEEIKRGLDAKKGIEVVVCPPFTSLAAVSAMITGTGVELGAQNMHWEQSGAFTGEVSAEMLRELYCHYVILGHSERRTLFRETDQDVNRKLKTALVSNLIPIVCVGETIKQRKSGQTESVLATQVKAGLAGVGLKEFQSMIIAYEPVWAIGTGVSATAEQAQDAHKFIRGLLKELADDRTASSIRIIYGGSVKPENAKELMEQPDIDGGLIGGASLNANQFLAIVDAALAA
jgi:triosephosphate isomerase (TIM)